MTKKNIESHVRSIESFVRQRYFKGDIAGNRIGVTGDIPFNNHDIMNLIVALDGIIDDDKTRLDGPKYLIVGRAFFNEDYVSQVINNEIVFLTQERFINHILFGVGIDKHYVKGEITNHPGLSYIDSLNGRLLRDEPVMNFGIDPEKSLSHWQKASFLRSLYRYNVQEAILTPERRLRLAQAVHGEGLYPIVNHIAFLVRLNKGKKRMLPAIDAWTRDLEWLRIEYYERGDDSFLWPDY